MSEELFEKLRQILGDVFDVPESEIQPDSSSADIETWDSMNQILLIATIEEEFGVRFPVGEFQKLKNVKLLLDEIEGRLK